MMEKLNALLEEYKNITIKLIDKAKKDEDLTEFINKSNSILQEIREGNYNQNEFEEILKELNIVNLENELRLTIKKEMVNIKRKIENIRTTKMARQTYRNSQQNLKLFVGKA